MAEVRYLSSEDVAELATTEEYVEAVRGAYAERGRGADAQPRTKLGRDDVGGMMTGYLAVLPEKGYMGGYMYAAGFGGNDAWFVTPVFDAAEGDLLAIIDGASMNPYKTGSTGAVATDVLARDDATELAIIGAGSQARGQLITTATVRDFEEVRVFSPTEESRESFAADFDEQLDATVEAVPSTTAAVTDADVIITATTASEPVLADEDVEPGTHVTAMGQYDPEKRELEAETVARATYVPDLRERAFQDAGSFLQALESGAIDDDHIHAELGEVVAGEAPGRTSDEEITVFDSGGTGVETIGAASMLLENARDADVGTFIDVFPASEAMIGN
ncbi:ornithine cyclodeaminase family protein [Haloplanus pelagicus]|jgi:alanine dehydrogenase|uniref:ornithine cyclodeaminase family protein n=1 Tax=Haloplanus pelagicus TaxID=2949995 RepID=UPI00203ACD55|nr:ornithine cyclodeaminase family protein [Haloplanus sp. HW8-1]